MLFSFIKYAFRLKYTIREEKLCEKLFFNMFFFYQSTEFLPIFLMKNLKFQYRKKEIKIYCTARDLCEGGNLYGESLSDRIYILLFGFDFT